MRRRKGGDSVFIGHTVPQPFNIELTDAFIMIFCPKHARNLNFLAWIFSS